MERYFSWSSYRWPLISFMKNKFCFAIKKSKIKRYFILDWLVQSLAPWCPYYYQLSHFNFFCFFCLQFYLWFLTTLNRFITSIILLESIRFEYEMSSAIFVPFTCQIVSHIIHVYDIKLRKIIFLTLLKNLIDTHYNYNNKNNK